MNSETNNQSSQPSVSLIFATSSRPTALEETLRSLANAKIPCQWSVELILVENVVQSGAEELLRNFPGERFHAVRYFFEPARGKSRALNLALSKAAGDILLFSDDDVRFPADWVEQMCEPIVSGRTDAVAGGVKLAPHLLRPWMDHTHRAWLASTADYLSPEDPSEMCGANMAISRRVFDRIDGFDLELGPGVTNGSEESLLSWQIKQAGFRVTGALDVQVDHHLNPDRLRYPVWVKVATLEGQSQAYLMHHWFHKKMPCPRIRHLYYRTKLSLRRLFSGNKKPDDEGIAPWELSYIVSAETCANYLRERRRPRNYALKGLRKLNLSQPESKLNLA